MVTDVLLGILLVVCFGTLAVLTVMALRGWLPGRTLQSVTVHTTEDQTLQGILDTVSSDGLVLRAATFVGQADEIPLSGFIFLPKAKVSFIQVEG